MTKAQFTDILNYVYANDCSCEYACEVLGYSEAIARAAHRKIYGD